MNRSISKVATYTNCRQSKWFGYLRLLKGRKYFFLSCQLSAFVFFIPKSLLYICTPFFLQKMNAHNTQEASSFLPPSSRFVAPGLEVETVLNTVSFEFLCGLIPDRCGHILFAVWSAGQNFDPTIHFYPLFGLHKAPLAGLHKKCRQKFRNVTAENPPQRHLKKARLGQILTK